LHDKLVNVLIRTGIDTIPLKGRSKHKVVPGWNEFVKKERETCLFWHKIWLNNGCPHTGTVADIRRRTRLKYHYAMRKVKKHEKELRATIMAESLTQLRPNDFWKEFHKNKSRSIISSEVDGKTSGDEICKLFAEKFSRLYTSVGYKESELQDTLSDIDLGINCLCMNGKCGYNHIVSVDEVKQALSQLKIGKTDCSSDLTTDHLINGTSRLYSVLSTLFQSMVTHGYTPGAMLFSSILPIVKDRRKSTTYSDNYRGIAISSVLGKVLDNIIINSTSVSSSQYQFGFKKGLSTTHCTFVADECINYYLSNDSSVYCILLDASKAFDKVNFIKLFKILLKKGFCPTVCRLLAFTYTNQCCNVKWNGCSSVLFPIRNGVKQGGVLSPLLFNLYIDGLLLKLAESGYGCYVGHRFAGALAYADDVVLLSPSIYGLKQLLKVCEEFSSDYDLEFNASKSKMIVFNGSDDFVPLKMKDVVIPITLREKHLGNLIGNNSSAFRIAKAVNELHISFNKLFSEFSCLDVDTRYFLFKTYCHTFYGCQLLDFSSKSINDIFVAWRKCIRKLLGLPFRTHCELIPEVINDANISDQLYKRVLKFVISCHKADGLSKYMMSLALNGSNSVMCRSINFISDNYGIVKYNILNSKLGAIPMMCEQTEVGQSVRAFLLYRNSFTYNSDDYINVTGLYQCY